MDASEVETIEGILRNYDVDGLLDQAKFSDLIDELRNRENIMISDALDQYKFQLPIAEDDEVEFTDEAVANLAMDLGQRGTVLSVDKDRTYCYGVRYQDGYNHFMASEVRKVRS